MNEEADYNTAKLIEHLPEAIRLGFSRYYEQKYNKLSPNLFNKVLDEVQKEKKKFIPKGSAQTTLPNLINIDNEIKYIRNKNKAFQQEIDKALSKLNFSPIPDSYSPILQSSTRNELKLKPLRHSHRDTKHLSVSPDIYINSILIPTSNLNPIKQSLSIHDSNRSEFLRPKDAGLENSYMRSRRINYSQNSNIHIYSTPEPQNNSFDSIITTKRTSRLNHFNNVVQKCENLQPTLRTQLPELQHKHNISTRNYKEVMRNISDLEDCLNIAKDMESLEDMMAIKKYNKKAEKEMLSTIQEMMQAKSSHRGHVDKVRKHKIWKYSIGNLLKQTERLLYSIPKSL